MLKEDRILKLFVLKKDIIENFRSGRGHDLTAFSAEKSHDLETFSAERRHDLEACSCAVTLTALNRLVEEIFENCGFFRDLSVSQYSCQIFWCIQCLNTIKSVVCKIKFEKFNFNNCQFWLLTHFIIIIIMVGMAVV